MAETNHNAESNSAAKHLQEIQKALTESNASERIKILNELESTLQKYKPEMNANSNGPEKYTQNDETPEFGLNLPTSNESSSSTESSGDSDTSVSSPDLLQDESVGKDKKIKRTNSEAPNSVDTSKFEDTAAKQNTSSGLDNKQEAKQCGNCGKLKKKHSSDAIQPDIDSENSDREVLCCSDSSEDEAGQDQLNIEYVSASQEEPSNGEVLPIPNRDPDKMRGLEINITKLEVPNKSNSSPPSAHSPVLDKVHAEFDIGAEISVEISLPSSTPTKCYSSPLLKKAPVKRSHGGKRRKEECTACHVTTINSSMKFISHPWLGVLICQKCLDFINSGEYSIEDGKEVYCRWCGDGGEIANCSSCEKSFCKHCLSTNLGGDIWEKILKDDIWKCFICDNAPIRHLVEECIQMLQEKEDLEAISKSKSKVIQARKKGRVKKKRGEREPSISGGEIEDVDSDRPFSPLPAKPTKIAKKGKIEEIIIPSTTSSEQEADGSDDSSSHSLSQSDLDLLDPKPNKQKRKRLHTESTQDESTKGSVSSGKEDEQDKKVKVRKKPRAKTNKKPRVLFGSSGDDGSAHDATLLPVGEISSDDQDSDLFPPELPKLEGYELQVGSEETESSSDICETELKVKKGKRGPRRKKKQSDSEDEAEKSLMKKSKSRKRGRKKAKLISDSSPTESDSDSGEGGKRRKGRRKIRKLIEDVNLSHSTLEAEKAEKERLERLKRRHTLSVDLTDQGDEGVEPLILEKESEGNDNSEFAIHPDLVRHLKPHQKEGVVFLWESVCESLKMLRQSEGSGSLLAHCMGLGKTLQVIALLDALLRYNERTGIKKVLVVTPVNVLYNWKSEFDKWVENRHYNLHVLETKEIPKHRIKTMEFWDSEGGVLLVGYDMFRNFSVGKKIKSQRKKDRIHEMLVDPGAQIVVCDEGHVMRNSKSGLSKCLNLIGTRRRIVLTGTPLQNNLQEYYCMTNFIKPNLLGSQTEFTNRFASPITNGQHADSTPLDVRVMKQRAHVLHSKLKGCVQRQNYTALTKYLPPKHEYVVAVRLTELQINLYSAFYDSLEKRELFPIYTVARRIWSHPWILKKEQEQQRAMMEKRNDVDSMVDFIASNTSEEEGSGSEPVVKKKKLEVVTMRGSVGRRISRRRAIDKNRELRDEMKRIDEIIEVDSSTSIDDEDYMPDNLIVESKPKVKRENEFGEEKVSSFESDLELEEEWPKDWFDDLIMPDVETQMEHSTKLLFLFELLDEAKKLNEKVLVFSQSLQLLDLIEFYLQRPEHDFVKGLHYYRMDGSTPIDTRDVSSSIFNNPKHPRMRLFLISTKAGSLGINLIAANRVVIMDASWNPTHDTQSIFRVYRFGQTKPVFIYRLIAKGTMEEKIYDRQVTKESLSLRVVDEQQIGRHFTSSDLAELFRFDPEEIRYKEPDFIRLVDSEDGDSTMLYVDAKAEMQANGKESILLEDNDVKPKLQDDKADLSELTNSKPNIVGSGGEEAKPEVSPDRERKDDKRPEADLVLCNILDKLQPKFIIDYHEHDSLTEHIFDEELSEEEKKAAWENFNASKEAISREYVQQMWQERQLLQTQHQQAQFEIARQMMEQGVAGMQPTSARLPVPPIHQMLATSSNQPVANIHHHKILKESVTQYRNIMAKNPALSNTEVNNLFQSIYLDISQKYRMRMAQQNQAMGIPSSMASSIPVPVSMMGSGYPVANNIAAPLPANLQNHQVVRTPVSILQPIERRVQPNNLQANSMAANQRMPMRPQQPLQQPQPQGTSHRPLVLDNSGLLAKSGAVGEKSYPSFAEQTYAVEDSAIPSGDSTTHIETVVITESPTK